MSIVARALLAACCCFAFAEACKPPLPAGPSAEYQQAIASFEKVLAETHDHDYLDPRFDAVIAALRGVPEPDRPTALTLVADMEKARAAALAHREKVASSVVQAEQAAAEARRKQAESARDNQ